MCKIHKLNERERGISMQENGSEKRMEFETWEAYARGRYGNGGEA